MINRVLQLVHRFFLPAKDGSLPVGVSRVAFLAYHLLFLILLSPLIVFRLPFASLVEPFTVFKSTDVIGLVNSARINSGLELLRKNSILTRAAQMKADDMLSRQYFSHTTPDGKEPWIFLDQEKYIYSAAGENLAADFLTARSAHEAFMASPGHRANILNFKYREIGVAVLSGELKGNRSIIIVQFFGTPRAILAVTEKNLNEASPLVVTTVSASTVSQVLGQTTVLRLGVGSRGNEVTRLQRLLAEDKSIYPEGAITGYFGALTKNAVVRFQEKFGVLPTGIYGPLTQAKLREVFGARIAEEKRPTTLGKAIEIEIPEAAQKLQGHLMATVAGAALLLLALLPILFTLTRKGYPGLAVFVRLIILLAFFSALVWTSRLENLPKLSFPAFSAQVLESST